MSSAILLLLQVLAQIIPSLTSSATITNIITTLVSLLPTLIKEVQDVAPLIQNIIDALRSNSVITPEQLAALDDLEVKVDAEFEAAVGGNLNVFAVVAAGNPHRR